MTLRMSGPRAVRLALFAVAAATVAAVGSGWALQPKGKEPAKPTSVHPAVAALQDDLELLEAQLKARQAAADAADKRVKSEEAMLKRIENVGTAAEIAPYRLSAERARVEAEVRAGELAEHKVRVRIAKRKLEEAIANPPPAAGTNPTEDVLRQLAKLLAERNAAEKEWMAKEAARQADEAKRQEADRAEQRDRWAREVKAREDERAEAKRQAALAEQRNKEAEERAKEEQKKRMEAELDRQRQEKASVLKRLPGEIADAELRLRSAELKREQVKLELDAASREIERLKAAKAHLDELRATLEKELKPKN